MIKLKMSLIGWWNISKVMSILIRYSLLFLLLSLDLTVTPETQLFQTTQIKTKNCDSSNQHVYNNI